MNNLTKLDIDKFLNMIAPGEGYHNDIIVLNITGNAKDETLLNHQFPIRLNAVSIILVLQGKIELTIDYITYQIKVNSLLDIGSLHVFHKLRLFPDSVAYHVIISKKFIEETLQQKKPLPLSYILSKRLNPLFKLKKKETKLLVDCIIRLKKNITRKEHTFQKELIQNELTTFFMEVGNISLQQDKGEKPQYALTRKDEIVAQFIQSLTTYCNEEQEVNFYANKLFITPQYLSQVLKEKTGKTTYNWINEGRITEAKIMLRTPGITINQIAETLHFSDQSAFGKFFKKNGGLSPSEYKKKITNVQ